MKKNPSETVHPLFLNRCLLLVIALFIFITSGYTETVTARKEILISRILNAYGGKEKLAKVLSISAEGRIKKNFPDDEGTYYRCMQRGKKLFVDIKYTNSSEQRILNGKKGYRGNNGKLEEVKGTPYDAMVYQYNQLDLPFGLVDGSLKVIDIHEDTLNGMKVEVLDLKDEDGYEIEAFVSAKDYLIQKVIGYFTLGRNKTNLAAEFMNFRDVQGIVLPFKIVNYSRASKLSETTILQYQINPEIDGSMFNPKSQGT